MGMVDLGSSGRSDDVGGVVSNWSNPYESAQPVPNAYQAPPQQYAAPPNYNAPTSFSHSPVPAPTMVDLGRIRVTESQIITPSGTMPLAGARFTFLDRSMTVRKTPTWAIVCTVVGFFIVTFFSLLFLLVKEDQTVGYVTVSVQGDGVWHEESIMVNSPFQVQDLYQRVQYANNLAASV